MRNVATSAALLALLSAGVSGPALAADLYEPIPAPPQVHVEREVVHVKTGGWYIRGDLDYHWTDIRGTSYTTYPGGGIPPVVNNSFTTAELKGSWSIGGGVGYQVNDHFRVDVTGDYWASADFTGSTTGVCGGVPCTSVDISAMSAFVLLANAYVDLGTYHGITPYIGAGIGGAYVMWDDLRNTVGGITTTHLGKDSWRFAAALMLGASYCLTENLDLDLGYRYTHVTGGKFFNFANGAGPGEDHGFNVHEVRAGVRWRFGDHGPRPGCREQEVVTYHPEPIPPVYK